MLILNFVYHLLILIIILINNSIAFVTDEKLKCSWVYELNIFSFIINNLYIREYEKDQYISGTDNLIFIFQLILSCGIFSVLIPIFPFIFPILLIVGILYSLRYMFRLRRSIKELQSNIEIKNKFSKPTI